MLTYAGLTNEDDLAAIRAFSRSLLHMLRGLADFNRIVAEIDTGRLCEGSVRALIRLY
jgi:hypothetical protein